jgi:hypothetical protein
LSRARTFRHYQTKRKQQTNASKIKSFLAARTLICAVGAGITAATRTPDLPSN